MDLVIRQKSSSADTEDDWLPQLESSIRCLQEMRHKNADLWVLLTSDSSRQTGRERESTRGRILGSFTSQDI